jgi:FAD/FMN-containing dehydrogenase
VSNARIEAFRASFGGAVIAPGDDAYEDARRVWNAMHDLRPALILRPASTAEVAVAIRFGREQDLEIAVRAGGHSAAGHSTTDGGLVIDLSGLRGVTVDPATRRARVRGGTLLGELDVAAQEHGLVCPVGVVGHTGVGGLTLGGGVGRLQRRFGLTIDNLRSVEIVTADGQTVRASETDEPDLFWGIRGAGPNFGVVTEFEFELQPFGGTLHRGIRMYPGTAAQEVWELLRDFAPRSVEELGLIYGIGRAQPAADYAPQLADEPIVFISYNHSGDAEAVQRDLAPLAAGPEPVTRTDSSQPYLEAQTANDLVMAWGGRSYIKGAYANDLSRVSIDALVALAAEAPVGSSFAATVQGGAIMRVADDATAFAGRSARFEISADSSWQDPALDDAAIDWARRAMAAVDADTVPGRYVNEIAESGPEETRAIYGDAKLARLRALKRQWDPENVFRRNHNVDPAPG